MCIILIFINKKRVCMTIIHSNNHQAPINVQDDDKTKGKRKREEDSATKFVAQRTLQNQDAPSASSSTSSILDYQPAKSSDDLARVVRELRHKLKSTTVSERSDFIRKSLEYLHANKSLVYSLDPRAIDHQVDIELDHLYNELKPFIKDSEEAKLLKGEIEHLGNHTRLPDEIIEYIVQLAISDRKNIENFRSVSKSMLKITEQRVGKAVTEDTYRKFFKGLSFEQIINFSTRYNLRHIYMRDTDEFPSKFQVLKLITKLVTQNRDIETFSYLGEEDLDSEFYMTLLSVIFSNLQKLKSLKVGDETWEIWDHSFMISPFVAYIIAKSQKNLEILHVNFEDKIPEATLLKIIKNNPNLRLLNMNDRSISEREALAIGDNLKSLEILWCHGDFLTSKGLLAIAKNCAQLKELELNSFNLAFLTEEIAIALGKLEHLEELVFAFSPGMDDEKRSLLEKYEIKYNEQN